ncbi:hypothetical protein ACHAP3_006154 [Botrytis cinerea]
MERSSPRLGNLEGRAGPGFEKWKQSWQLKMTLMDWRETKSSWEVIASELRKRGVEKSPSAWSCMWKRCNAEVEAMAMAAAADKEEEYDRIIDLVWRLGAITGAAEADFDGVWSRMSAAMSKHGSRQSWTPQKVEYAWNNGVSARFPNIRLCPFLR